MNAIKNQKCKYCGKLIYFAYWSGMVQAREDEGDGCSIVHFCRFKIRNKNEKSN